jgi:hypothetical protein
MIIAKKKKKKKLKQTFFWLGEPLFGWDAQIAYEK